MTACVPITQEKVRAELWMGTTLLAKTPFVRGFSVSKSRAQITSNFNITFELLAGTTFSIGDNLVIKAGTKGNLKNIFNGLIESTASQPTFGKPSYFSVTLAGKGILSQLEGKKFTRRLRAEGEGLFCLITGGSPNRPDAYSSLDKKVVSGNHTVLRDSPNPAASAGEHSPIIKSADKHANQATGGYLGELAGDSAGSGAGGTGFRSHTHESESEGGPAFGVYSAD